MVELRQLKGYYYSYLFSAPASGVERHDFYESCAMMFSMILWRLRGVWRDTDTDRVAVAVAVEVVVVFVVAVAVAIAITGERERTISCKVRSTFGVK